MRLRKLLPRESLADLECASDLYRENKSEEASMITSMLMGARLGL